MGVCMHAPERWGLGERCPLWSIFSMLYASLNIAAAETLVLAESQWGSPTENSTAPSSVLYLSLVFSSDHLLVSFGFPLAPSPPHPKLLLHRQLLQQHLLKWLHK